MENDTIRSSGGNTLVDIWIDGKMRGICVTRGAVEMHLGLPADQAALMSDEDRCEFVRTNLTLIMKAATSWLRKTSPIADTITIDTGQLGVRGQDRRKTERRKTERRKVDRPGAAPSSGERRRGSRRRAERRVPSTDASKG